MMDTGKERAFVSDAELPWEDLGGHLKRKIMTYDDHLMMVKVAFEKGGVGTLHSHYHTQMSYVESGEFEITIGERQQVLRQGDAFYIAPHIVHGALCLSAGTLVDIFTPMRQDFVSNT